MAQIEALERRVAELTAQQGATASHIHAQLRETVRNEASKFITSLAIYSLACAIFKKQCRRHLRLGLMPPSHSARIGRRRRCWPKRILTNCRDAGQSAGAQDAGLGREDQQSAEDDRCCVVLARQARKVGGKGGCVGASGGTFAASVRSGT